MFSSVINLLLLMIQRQLSVVQTPVSIIQNNFTISLLLFCTALKYDNMSYALH